MKIATLILSTIGFIGWIILVFYIENSSLAVFFIETITSIGIGWTYGRTLTREIFEI